MNNNYFTQVAPYMQQDQGGLTPVFQNIGAQQALQNQLMQQQLQQSQDASNIAGSMGKGLSGINPLAMASMLRGKKPEMMGTGQTPNWTNPYANYNNGNGIGSSGIE
jgi:hypothetical protein